jgi:two-component system, chemotaxis family, CheB/CheR fusion protein
MPRDQSFEGFAVEDQFPAVGRVKLLLNARRVIGQTGEPPLILLVREEGGAG